MVKRERGKERTGKGGVKWGKGGERESERARNCTKIGGKVRRQRGGRDLLMYVLF